ncbi:MAG: TRAP transporter large permease [Alphaproteobacteria bacterium]|nr:TRAP transporter large permease [Alphaproteobacteria bacterium]
MDLQLLMIVTLIGLIVSILLGIHIGLALGLSAFFGTWAAFGAGFRPGYDVTPWLGQWSAFLTDWTKGLDRALSMVGNTAFEQLRREIFAAIPLFVLMGDLVAKSGCARDLYNLINRGLSVIPGRLAVATVIGNAVFSAVTGVSIASAAAFSRIAYPQMMHYGYKRSFALGSVAGSACLGMLIPPSILMIIWGITIEESVGKLFLAGVLPGIILAGLFVLYSIISATVNPSVAPKVTEHLSGKLTLAELVSGFGIIALIMGILGGIWAGFFTSFEAAGVGALGALLLGVIKGMRWRGVADAVIDAAKTAAPLLILLLTAAMYSKFLTLSNIIPLIKDALINTGLEGIGIILMMVVIWLVLGMLLDSVSIILLTLPLFWPIAQDMGTDPFVFAIFGILAIEAGLLTPPLGLLVYTVKGAVPDPTVKLGEIFKGSIPYWLLMLVAMVLVWEFPVLATALHKKPVSRVQAPPVPAIQVEAAVPEWHLLRL